MMATRSISRKITSILYLMKIMPAFWMKTEFCEVMFGLRKKNLKEKSYLWCLRKLVRLCAEDVGHT